LSCDTFFEDFSHEATVTALAEKEATTKDAIKKTLSNFDICFLLF
jgi:hypothetical protein